MSNITIFTFSILMILLTGLVIGFLFGRKRKSDKRVTRFSSLEKIRSIGELTVLKIFTKEIVAQEDHALGNFGRKYLQPIITNKKIVMIFDFVINCSYDLKSPGFIIERSADRFTVTLPCPKYDVNIRNISFYDEQRSQFLPFLLPGLLQNVLGGGFSVEDKNRLIEEAKNVIREKAHQLVMDMRIDIEASARKTLERIAFSFAEVEGDILFREGEEMEVRASLGKETA
ncbi:MAG: DUF4230 domain-containing protein [Synergistales bacterium]|nr:DUF4230 domain-containing protein [Synergistales bacterium]